MLRSGRCILGLALFLLAATLPVQAEHIRGKVVRIGFPGSGRDVNTQGLDSYRPGFWTPIVVELNNDDGDLFEGHLEARQVDRDGDQIVSTLPVSIRGSKEVFIYVPAGPPQAQQPFVLRVVGPDHAPIPLFDDGNNPATEWRPASDPRPIAASAVTLLDISQQPLNQLSGLARDARLVRELMVLRSSPMSLPDSAAGLQMIDLVVWDGADPSQFRDLSQQQALLDWVRRGGTLVLAASKNWQLISKSDFGPLLPAPLTGITSSDSLDKLSEVLTGTSSELRSRLPYCPVKRSQLAPEAISILPADDDNREKPKPDDLVFVSSRPYGKGKFVLVTAEIDALLKEASTGRTDGILRRILGIRTSSKPTEQYEGGIVRTDAFQGIEGATAFRVTSGLYFLAAFLFVVVYILVATGGSWSVLRRRRRVHYAWPVFALVALIASGTSLAAVQFIRGIGHRVQQLCVLDTTAGSSQAVANCYFGFKTASHMSVDLAVPRDAGLPMETADNPGGLLPLPVASDDFMWSQYSAGQRYQAGGPVGQLWNVPMRATLKQFQGYWHGQMRGGIDASLMQESGSRFALTSWIQNRLDVDLEDCFLLQTNQNLVLNTTQGRDATPTRASRISVFPIGKLPRGKKLTWREVLIERLKQQRSSSNSDAPIDEDNPVWVPPLLSQVQQEWLSRAYRLRDSDAYGAREAEIKTDTSSLRAQLLLISTYGELSLDRNTLTTQDMTRTRGFDLDCSDRLTTSNALLLGFTDRDPGPVRLAWRPAGGVAKDWKTITPAEAGVMYRVQIPIASK